MEVSRAQQLRVLEIAIQMLRAGYVESHHISDMIHCAFQYEEVLDLMEHWYEASDPLMASALLAEIQSEVGNILMLENAEPDGNFEDDSLQQ